MYLSSMYALASTDIWQTLTLRSIEVLDTIKIPLVLILQDPISQLFEIPTLMPVTPCEIQQRREAWIRQALNVLSDPIYTMLYMTSHLLTVRQRAALELAELNGGTVERAVVLRRVEEMMVDHVLLALAKTRYRRTGKCSLCNACYERHRLHTRTCP